MKKKTGSVAAVPISMIVLLLAIALAPEAYGSEPGWAVSFEGVWVDPDLGYTTYSDDDTPVDVTDKSDTGFGLTASYRYTDRISVQLGYFQSRPGVRLSSDLDGSQTLTVISDLSMQSYWMALKVHLLPDHTFDLFVSPMLIATSFGDLDYTIELPDGSEQSISVSVDKDMGWGIGLGADIPLGGSPWYATSVIRYIDTALEVEETSGEFTDHLDFDSMVVGLGLGYRF